MSTYLNVAQIIISLVLIVVVLLQTKGSSFGGAFSTDASIFRTRRGLEKTLFQLSLGLAAAFVLVSILTVYVASQG